MIEEQLGVWAKLRTWFLPPVSNAPLWIGVDYGSAASKSAIVVCREADGLLFLEGIPYYAENFTGPYMGIPKLAGSAGGFIGFGVPTAPHKPEHVVRCHAAVEIVRQLGTPRTWAAEWRLGQRERCVLLEVAKPEKFARIIPPAGHFVSTKRTRQEQSWSGRW